jgi:cytochrome c oxidase subunit 2
MKRHLLSALSVSVIVFALGAIPLCLSAQAPSHTIEVHAKRFVFSPSEVTIKKGDTVKLVLISDDVTHSLVVDGLRVNEEIKKGQPSEVTLSPSSTGDFKGRCGHFCGSGHARMVFVVHVVG